MFKINLIKNFILLILLFINVVFLSATGPACCTDNTCCSNGGCPCPQGDPAPCCTSGFVFLTRVVTRHFGGECVGDRDLLRKVCRG